jgi:hypothetical protein
MNLKTFTNAVSPKASAAAPLGRDCSIYQPNELYYTAAKALEIGIERIRIVIGYQ